MTSINATYTAEEECSWEVISDGGDSKSSTTSSTKSVSFADELIEIREVEKLSMQQICGDWGATVRGDKTDDPHWSTVAGMRIGQERDIFEAWKKLVSN